MNLPLTLFSKNAAEGGHVSLWKRLDERICWTIGGKRGKSVRLGLGS